VTKIAGSGSGSGSIIRGMDPQHWEKLVFVGSLFTQICGSCRGLTRATCILCIEHLRMLRSVGNRTWGLLHCRRTLSALSAKSHSNGVLVAIRNLSLCCYTVIKVRGHVLVIVFMSIEPVTGIQFYGSESLFESFPE
jgi:hypothetical protein